MSVERIFPNIGDKLYLHQKTGSYYIDQIKRPYTVIDITKTKVIIQSAKCIFNGPIYFDSFPDEIVEDKEGDILELSWAPVKKRWQIDKYKTGYPEIAEFGYYEYFPYLD